MDSSVWWLWYLLLWKVAIPAMRVLQEEPFPNTCEGGQLSLTGRYKVSSQITITEKCRVVGSQATVVVEEEILFKKDVRFIGSIRFVGQEHRGPQARCLEVEGRLAFMLAAVTFEGCGGPETEDGGGIYGGSDVTSFRSNITFERCQAIDGGGLFVGQNFKSSSSTFEFKSCEAHYSGGGMLVKGNVTLASWAIARFESCRATDTSGHGLGGGGLAVSGDKFTASGNISFHNCSAFAGGGLSMPAANSVLANTGGIIAAKDCRAQTNGGGLLVSSLRQAKRAHMDFQSCFAGQSGAGIAMHWNGRLRGTTRFVDGHAVVQGGAISAQTLEVEGRMEIRRSRAFEGGGIALTHKMIMSKGDVYMEKCFAHTRGGCIFAISMVVASGNLDLKEASAMHTGGAVFVQGIFKQLDGRIAVANSSAALGGGIRCSWFLQYKGLLSVEDTIARETNISKLYAQGGGIYMHGGLGQAAGGEILIRNSTAGRQGGGGIRATMIMTVGKLTMEAGHASKGGCITISQKRPTLDRLSRFSLAKFLNTLVETTGYDSKEVNELKEPGENRVAILGTTRFKGCNADIGGAIFSQGTVHLGKVDFFDSYASGVSGGAVVYALAVYFHTDTTVKNCRTPKGSVFSAKKILRMKNATFQDCSSPQAAADLLIADHLVVSGGNGAAFLAPNRTVKYLECDNGLEGHVDTYGTACRQCRTGHFQLQGGPKIFNNSVIEGHPCAKVPLATVDVTDGRLTLRPGWMVHPQNFSASLHCPNERACPGGNITQTGFEGMCEVGYEGPGCVSCVSTTHGRESGDPFTCAKCATSTLGKSFEWCAYLLQHSIVFAVSASGVIASTDQSYKSTIHSNQLMAYVMVALPVLNQVSNSQSFKVLAYFGQEVIEALKIPVDVANGAGGDGLSSQCLLDYIGISKTLYGGDILFLILALSLMLLLSLLVDVWSAVVVACNCYLPRLCFAFGRHLVCYRLSTEDRGGQLFCGFEEDVSMPVPLTIVLLIIVCVAGPSSWLWLIRHEQITSPGAVYLTGPYKKDHKFWEVTVLLRKVLLALVSSVWPSSLDAVMQLEFIGLILLISLVVTLHNRPYLAQEHNRTEEHLLELGMLMVLATFCFHANDAGEQLDTDGRHSEDVFDLYRSAGHRPFPRDDHPRHPCLDR